MELADKTALAEKRLARLRELAELPMATETAKELWRQRLTFYVEYYVNLLSQLKNSEAITD